VPVRKPALPALTGLRAILAVNIMFFHFTPPHIGLIRPIVDNAFVFVGFFFLISGFVLAYNYADRPSLSKRAFYLARFSRVYPVYLFALVISIPFLFQEWHARSPHDFYLGLILTPLTLQGWSPLLATFWNTVAWTLPAETMLYAIFPFMLLALAALFRGPLRRFDSVPWLIATILGIWLLGITPHTLYYLFNPDHLTEPVTRYTYAYWLRAIKYTPPLYVCTFTAGVLLSRLHAALPLTPKRRGLLAVSSLACLGLFFAFAAGRVPYVLVHGALLLPLFATLLIGLAGPNPVSSIFAWTPLVRFGETTFALYLLHFNVFQMIHLYHVPERLNVVAFDPWISYLAIILLAFAVHFLYEQPARRFVMNLFSPKP
jgi:peptidoglycan/LPS O-acetylase OafA/YrhL